LLLLRALWRRKQRLWRRWERQKMLRPPRHVLAEDVERLRGEQLGRFDADADADADAGADADDDDDKRNDCCSSAAASH